MKQPIGLFDSGLGGLTVMREISRLLPRENLIYLADTAHLPYGNNSPQIIVQYAKECASFLLRKGIKLLVIPCHTACCHAIEVLQKEFPIPVIGVIEAGLEISRTSSRLALLGTSSTIESGLYQQLLHRQNPNIKVIAKACPLFVPLIENGDPLAIDLMAKIYLSELKDEIDAALLACTHYPLITHHLQKALGSHIPLLDPAKLCAEQVKNLLVQTNLLNTRDEKPLHQFYATGDQEKFQRKLKKIRFYESLLDDAGGDG